MRLCVVMTRSSSGSWPMPLKGSSANISAHQLSAVLLELEKMGKNNTLAGADKLLADMEKKFEALLARISRLREELK